MINIADKKDCCGCNACVEQCRLQCMAMVTDKEGFWYPEIDKDKCIDCGMCEKVCPIINPILGCESDKTKTWGMVAKDDEIRRKSSSGGVFSLLAISVIEQGGKVYGAAFDDNMMVHHTGVDSVEGLELLRGSKYLQSSNESVYSEIKRELNNGREVLYSGTECQVEALKHYLEREYDNLTTVDILCHGVPSPKVWRKYLDYQEKKAGAKVVKAGFRDKSGGWRLFSVKLEFENGKTYCGNLNEDIFMKMFLKNICLRPSCHKCRFKDIHRKSDITIGDFWGVENVLPEYDDDEGISVVITHSDKGEMLIQSLSNCATVKRVETDVALPTTADSRCSVVAHKNRDKFFSNIDTYEADSLVKYVKESPPKLFIAKCRRKIKHIIKN